ncbi:MAG TPA: hypothetical protein VGP93_01865 [Polyangiaceae bacterium]|jgi:hypothetical protein|nr:hypothetical protein [Polyangiaceae bacterium]
MTVTTTEGVSYFGYEGNIRLANADVELILPTAFGPRVMRYSLINGSNVFGDVSPAEQGNETPYGDKWHLYGGHRLWYAPEANPGSYFPDNQPVETQITGGSVRLTQAIEPHTGLQKCIEVTLESRGSHVRVLHRLTNHGSSELELAPWALSVMAQGGLGIFPQAPFEPHPKALAPARPLVLWHFTRMNDPRWTWGDRLFFLRQDPKRSEAQKVGFYNDQGWMAYALGELVFVKRHEPAPGAHADFGCNAETFTNGGILELETLGPLVRLQPGANVTHVEDWLLFDGVKLGESEAEILRALEPLIATRPG